MSKVKPAKRVRGANYSPEYKAIAVMVSRAPGMEVKRAATILRIHPVMLTQWRTALAKRTDDQLWAIARSIDLKLIECDRKLAQCEARLKAKRK
jgi:transposase-like protein